MNHNNLFINNDNKSLQMQLGLQRVPANKEQLFRNSLLFSNNSLLFYPLFYMKIEICFLYKGFLIRGNPLYLGSLEDKV